MTTLLEPNRDASNGYSPLIRVFGWPGTLYGLYQANDLQGALNALQRFADLYETGQIPEYHNTVDTILNWSDPSLAGQGVWWEVISVLTWGFVL